MSQVKRCSKCNKSKSFSEFHKDRTHSSGLQRYCKDCKKKVDAHGKSEDDGKYILYYLPKERYIGMTKNFTKRKQKHEKAGKDIRWAFVVMKTKKVRFAHLMETLFHMLGFNGFRY